MSRGSRTVFEEPNFVSVNNEAFGLATVGYLLLPLGM